MSWGLGSAIPTVDELHELNAAATAAAVREVLGGGVRYYGPAALWTPPEHPAERAGGPLRLHKPRASRPTPSPRQVQVREPLRLICWNAYGLPASAADANRWLAAQAEAHRIAATMLRAIGREEICSGTFDGRGIA